MPRTGEFDLIPSFAYPLPAAVIAELIVKFTLLMSEAPVDAAVTRMRASVVDGPVTAHG